MMYYFMATSIRRNKLVPSAYFFPINKPHID